MKEAEIFHQAPSRSRPEVRAAYREQACAGDPALRAPVEALMWTDVGASGFLDRPVPAPEDQAMSGRGPVGIEG